jgi:hypothetical protein
MCVVHLVIVDDDVVNIADVVVNIADVEYATTTIYVATHIPIVSKPILVQVSFHVIVQYQCVCLIQSLPVHKIVRFVVTPHIIVNIIHIIVVAVVCFDQE